MKIFDKAKWHIDEGIPEEAVFTRLTVVYQFLNEKQLLSSDGIEEFEFGCDSSTSLNEFSVTKKGNAFLTDYYDKLIGFDSEQIKKKLEEYYVVFCHSSSLA